MHMNKMNKALYEDYNTLVKAKIYGSYLKQENLSSATRMNVYVMENKNISFIRKLISSIYSYEGISNIFQHSPYPKYYIDVICIVDPDFASRIKKATIKHYCVKATDTHQREKYLYKYIYDKELIARGYESNEFVMDHEFLGPSNEIDYRAGEKINVETWIEFELKGDIK